MNRNWGAILTLITLITLLNLPHTLPAVTLAWFKATPGDGEAFLEWETASEVNNNWLQPLARLQ